MLKKFPNGQQTGTGGGTGGGGGSSGGGGTTGGGGTGGSGLNNGERTYHYKIIAKHKDGGESVLSEKVQIMVN
jgi:hypothetical protein